MPWNICKCTLCQCIWYVLRNRKQCTIREENKTQDCNNNNLLIINSSCSLFCCFGCLFLIFISLFFLFALLFPSVACVLVFHLHCSHFVWYEHFCKCKHTLQLVYFSFSSFLRPAMWMWMRMWMWMCSGKSAEGCISSHLARNSYTYFNSRIYFVAAHLLFEQLLILH